MLLRNVLSLTTPCLALFLLACNDTASHQQAQPQAAPTPVAAQKDPSVDQPAATPKPSAEPSSAALKQAHPALRHHVAYAHHRMTRPAPVAPASTENASLAEPTPAPAANVTLPTGTVLAVQLVQELGSKTSNAGDAFTATVSEPVIVDGKQLIPEGSTVTGKVTEATPMGTLHKGVLHLTLSSIHVNGQDQTIETSTVSELDKSQTETAGDVAGNASAAATPTAATVAVAAPATALTGATPASGLAGAAPAAGLAGMGKGAGFAGGGLKAEAEAKAGTVVAAITGNKDLVFPAQTLLKFTLEQAVDLKP